MDSVKDEKTVEVNPSPNKAEEKPVAKPVPKTANKKATNHSKAAKSRKRMGLDEFAITHGIRSEVKAGFKVWLKGQLHHFEPEWDKLFHDYMHRDLKKSK